MNKHRMIQNTVLLALMALFPAIALALIPPRIKWPHESGVIACRDKSEGDAVEFVDRRGIKTKAICEKINGQLTAVPVSAPGRVQREGVIRLVNCFSKGFTQ